MTCKLRSQTTGQGACVHGHYSSPTRGICKLYIICSPSWHSEQISATGCILCRGDKLQTSCDGVLKNKYRKCTCYEGRNQCGKHNQKMQMQLQYCMQLLQESRTLCT